MHNNIILGDIRQHCCTYDISFKHTQIKLFSPKLVESNRQYKIIPINI